MEKKPKRKFVKDYLEPILIAILIALFIRAFVVQAFKIPSGSMEPTLLVGDYLLVNKFIYGIRIPYTNVKFLQFKKPQRGEVIVFIFPVDPSKDFIKRVIGTEGEKVEVIHNKIYINDRLIEDPWGHFATDDFPRGYLQRMENFGPVVVPKDSLFVMGDNRDNSEDSRFWGFLNVNAVLGKAFIMYFSWNGNAESLLHMVRWSRIGKLIH
ncbi:MAG TPA: signal peptidase I [Thermodesulfobacteriota bacterium]|nr:signal peptidase I [Thermodesulfobacteriota bacterium]